MNKRSIRSLLLPIVFVATITLPACDLLSFCAGLKNVAPPSGGSRPTPPPVTSVYVDAAAGRDSNPGTQQSPFQTLTHAAASVGPGSMVFMAAGDYSVTTGERFPINVSGLTIQGSRYGEDQSIGTYVDGSGTRNGEQVTLLVLPANGGVATNLSQLYVGSNASSTSGPVGEAVVVEGGTLMAADVQFGSDTAATTVAGILARNSAHVQCRNCLFSTLGAVNSSSDAGIQAVQGSTIVVAAIQLDPYFGSLFSSAAGTGIVSDGSASITVEGQTFHGFYAFCDCLQVNGSTDAGAVDLGGGSGGSAGLNSLRLAPGGYSEIQIAGKNLAIEALHNTWNANTQGTDSGGKYSTNQTFVPGTAGQNVTILSSGLASSVTVGP